MTLVDTEPAIFVDGQRQAVGGTTYEVINPYTLNIVGRAVDATAADVDAAVRSARRAFDEGPWPRMSFAERAAVLERVADELEARGPVLAATVTAEMGQPTSLSTVMAGVVPAAHFRYYASVARSFEQERQRDNIVFAGQSVIRAEALGVAALIVPWNFPLSLTTSKLAPALAAGCTVVIKPAAETPFDSLLLAEAVSAAGVPDGVVNVVTGGRETGAALVEHPLVNKVAFTGSTEAGRHIAAACGRRLVPVTLELGGKSAAIVRDDADVDTTLAALRNLSFMNSGQTCFLLSRVLVPEHRLNEYTEGLVAQARSLVLGDPTLAATEQGPLVSERIRDRVQNLVGRAQSFGAQVATGGGRVGSEPGWFYQPTVITGATPDSEIAQEEVFGPVVVVLPYRDDAEAIAIANNSRYGLGGAIFSSDHDRAVEMARGIRTGTIGINGYGADLAIPFGGYRDSGLGREHGPEALENFLQTKAIYA